MCLGRIEGFDQREGGVFEFAMELKDGLGVGGDKCNQSRRDRNIRWKRREALFPESEQRGCVSGCCDGGEREERVLVVIVGFGSGCIVWALEEDPKGGKRAEIFFRVGHIEDLCRGWIEQMELFLRAFVWGEGRETGEGCVKCPGGSGRLSDHLVELCLGCLCVLGHRSIQFE